MIQRIIKLLVKDELEKQVKELIKELELHTDNLNKQNSNWQKELTDKQSTFIEQVSQHNRTVEGWLKVFLSKSGIDV